MSDDKKIILCITEGAKTERNILNPLARHYLAEENIEIYHFGASIYELYQALVDDKDIETYRLLQEIVYNKKQQKLDYPRRQILGIYLFFDFEGHAQQATDIHQGMLQRFNDETTNGKLYFSYPMVEAYKHPFNIQDVPSVVTIVIEEGYKKLVAEICDKKLENLKKLLKSEWDTLLLDHLVQHNHLINNQTSLPNHYSADDFTQLIIYQSQLDKHILPNQEVRVISPFSVFLLDYLGNGLLDEWKHNKTY